MLIKKALNHLKGQKQIVLIWLYSLIISLWLP